MLDAETKSAGALAVFEAMPHSAERVYSALTLAFVADPASRWLFTEADNFLLNFPKFARALAGPALHSGTGLVMDNYAAVALWLAPGEGPDEQALGELIETVVAREKQDDMAAVVEEMGRYHPKGPHWYLPLIGVEPSRQGQGLGSALLRTSLSRCDADGLPAYLESSNPKNQPLYERHGFQAIGEIKIRSCPPIVPMLRRPRS
jgi:ribosomal protein S18 acetylase RimI-like enzyme